MSTRPGCSPDSAACWSLRLHGGVETLVTRPALTSHAAMSVQDRGQLGVTDDLIRISCGIEHPAGLIEDFGHALDR